MHRQAQTLLLILLFTGSSLAQTANPRFSGEEVIDFSLVDVISNTSVSLSDFKGSRAVVVVFTSNYCPYAKIYEDRIASLHQEYASKNVDFLLINSNNSSLDDKDTEENMRAHATERGYAFPYLADKKSVAKNAFMAEKTPETFIVVPRDNVFQLAYHGAIDDNPQSPDQVESNYVKMALDNIVAQRPTPISYKRPVGCRIKSQ